jgi:hypothetical protein
MTKTNEELRKAACLAVNNPKMGTMVSMLANTMIDAEKRVEEFAETAKKDPRYAIRWAGRAIRAQFAIRFCRSMFYAIANPEQMHWSEVIEELRTDVMRGRYECKSTCLFDRGVGEEEVDEARRLCDLYGRAVKTMDEFDAISKED